MTVLIIQICDSPIGGGAELIANKLSELIKIKNAKSYGIFLNNKNKIKLKSNQIVIGNYNPKNLLNFFKLYFKIIKLAKGYSRIILHGHLVHALYFLVPFSFLKRFTLLYTEHSEARNRRKYHFIKPIEKYIYSRYKKVFSISPQIQSNLLNWLDIYNEDNKSKKKFFTIYNGATKYKFLIRNYEKDKYNLLSIGNLHIHKGFDITIKAISHCKEIVKSYTIVGEGSNRKSLQEIINQRNLSKIIKLHGYDNRIHKFLKKSDLGLIPSRWEGFGLVGIEMLSSGIPLCISNAKGMSDILKDFNTQKIINHLNEKVWAENIIQMLQSLDSMKKDIKKSSVMASKFSLEEMIKNYSKQYIEIIRSFNC